METIEENYSEEYPNGDMVEPHDIERDRELENINEELEESKDLEAQQADLEPERRQEREAEESCGKKQNN